MESLEEIPKKIQYINVDSQYVNGGYNTFSVNLGLDSNIFVQEMKDVIGIKVVDFYILQVGTSGGGAGNDDVKYIDIVCDDVPVAGQILDERMGRVLTRIPLERGFDSSVNFKQHDKQWQSFDRKTNYFNPISIKQLNFKLYEFQGDGDYVLMKPQYPFYFTLEITTIDHKEPPKDTNLRVVRAIEKLCKKVDRLNNNVIRIPKPEPKKKIPLRYVLVPIILAIFGYFYMKPKPQPQPQFIR